MSRAGASQRAILYRGLGMPKPLSATASPSAMSASPTATAQSNAARKVRELPVDCPQRFVFRGRVETSFGLTCQPDVVLRVAVAHDVAASRCVEVFERVLTDRLEEPVAARATPIFFDDDQRLVDELAQQIKNAA